MVNAGVLHRVGPSRVHVALGRALAQAGIPALRFDLGGIGDSEPRHEPVPFDVSAVRDVREALDFLAATRDLDRFILFGICAGAHVAFRSAVADPRVAGLVSIDGYAYRTRRYHLVHYSRRALRWSSWAGFVRRQVRRLRAGAAPRPAPFGAEAPPRLEVERDLRSLVRRGVPQLHIFTGAHGMRYNYRAQFRDMFQSVDFGRTLSVELWADTGHTFEDPEARRRLVRNVSAWAAGCRDRAGRSASRLTGAAHARSAPSPALTVTGHPRAG
jgi:dienelactone hydrolase